MQKRTLLIAALFMGITVAVYLTAQRKSESVTSTNAPLIHTEEHAEETRPDNTDADTTSNKETLTAGNFNVVDFMQWKSDRGHFDDFSKTDYASYSLETLNDLVENKDRLAMLTLAEKLSTDEDSEQRVISLYEEAAVLGYTYVLTRLGDFKLTNKVYRLEMRKKLTSEGQLTDHFIDGLKYLAAAELSGDPFMTVAFDYQTRNIDPDVLTQAQPLICASGQNVLNALEAQRDSLGLGVYRHSEQVLQIATQGFNHTSFCKTE